MDYRKSNTDKDASDSNLPLHNDSHDNKPFIDSITARIAIHSSHQQRCENHAQLAVMASKTNVGEKRRTWRAIYIVPHQTI
jgi:hypothetical protein